jgi:hypothetical protein
MNIWTALMLLAGGLFAGGVATIAWSHAAHWKTMPTREFVGAFERTIRTADKVQPALLVATIAATAAAFTLTEGIPRIAAATGLAGFVAILVVSAAVLVPLQRRIVASSTIDADEIASMRRRWIRGHLGRSALALASFVAVVVAAVT